MSLFAHTYATVHNIHVFQEKICSIFSFRRYTCSIHGQRVSKHTVLLSFMVIFYVCLIDGHALSLFKQTTIQ